MSILVKTFDNEKVKKAIKEADPLLQEYIKALKKVSDGWENLFKIARKKINKLIEEKNENS